MTSTTQLEDSTRPADDLAVNCFIWARRRDQSIWRRLLFQNASQAGAGVEHLENSACAFTGLLSQYEREWQETVRASLSARERTTFVDAPSPYPPRPYNFENRSEVFPLRDSIKVVTCDACKGSGRICGKRGCSESGGKHARHEECEGTGQLATWQAVHFDYRRVDRTRAVYPMDRVPFRVKRAYQRWLARNPQEIETFTLIDARKHIPWLPENGERVVDKAANAELELRAESSRGPGHELFVKPRRYLTPFAYGVSRLNGRGDHHYIIGDRNAEHVAPLPRPDVAKMCAWIFLLTTIFLAQGIPALFGFTFGWAPSVLRDLHESTSIWGPAVLTLLSTLAVIPGFRKMRATLEQPVAVIVLPTSGRRSQYVRACQTTTDLSGLRVAG